MNIQSLDASSVPFALSLQGYTQLLNSKNLRKRKYDDFLHSPKRRKLIIEELNHESEDYNALPDTKVTLIVSFPNESDKTINLDTLQHINLKQNLLDEINIKLTNFHIGF